MSKVRKIMRIRYWNEVFKNWNEKTFSLDSTACREIVRNRVEIERRRGRYGNEKRVYRELVVEEKRKNSVFGNCWRRVFSDEMSRTEKQLLANVGWSFARNIYEPHRETELFIAGRITKLGSLLFPSSGSKRTRSFLVFAEERHEQALVSRKERRNKY